jgi:hypothetical protein
LATKKQKNYSPIGKNSPNLVTLRRAETSSLVATFFVELDVLLAQIKL